MKRILPLILVIIVISLFTACIAEEIPEETLNRLKEHCYINPDGGQRLHTDQNCRSVHEKYLPLTEVEFSDELLKQYSLCPVCTLVDEPQEEPAAPADPKLVISEAELKNVTAGWVKQYGDYKKWDYQVNAAFVSEVGTLPDTPYVFDKSVLPIMPDEDAIPAEEIAGKAIPLAASYGSRLTEDVLKDIQVIVSQYRKPDNDVYLFSTTGSWLVSFWENDDIVAWMYVDAHTGVPNFLNIVSDCISFQGEPGVEGMHYEE